MVIIKILHLWLSELVRGYILIETTKYFCCHFGYKHLLDAEKVIINKQLILVTV